MPKLTGYAAVFNSLSVDLGGFVERIDPAAFGRSIAGDIRLLMGHQTDGVPLARTKSGTLTLDVDSRGLHFSADLPDSPSGSDVFEAVRRGDLSAMSFGFAVRKDSWEKSSGVTVRTLLDIDLHEVSVVAWPAYPGTTALAVPQQQQQQQQRASGEGKGLDVGLARAIFRLNKMKIEEGLPLFKLP